MVASACDDSDPKEQPPVGAAGSLGDTPADAATNGQGRGASLTGAAADGGQALAALSDPEIVSVLSSANAGVIERSTIATDAAENDRVRAWAEELSAEHLAAQERLTALVASGSIEDALNIGEAENAVAQQLQAGTQRVVMQLRDTTGQRFDALYVQTQIADHTQLLELIDTQLTADNALLRAELQRVRNGAARQLQRARALQASLDLGEDDADGGAPDTDAGR